MNRNEALEALAAAVTRWIEIPISYTRMEGEPERRAGWRRAGSLPPGMVSVWFDNEYALRLPLAAVLELWPDAKEASDA